MQKPMAKAKETIRNVFLQLLEDNDFSKISVSAIIEKAQINKSTFYKYYASKYDLLEEMQDELFRGFVTRMKEVRPHSEIYKKYADSVGKEEKSKKGDVYPGFLSYFDYVEDNKDKYLLFAKRMQDKFTTRHRQFIMKYCMDERSVFDYWGEDPELSANIHAVIISSCYTGLIHYWLDSGMQMSKEEMAAMVTLLWKRLTGLPASGG